MSQNEATKFPEMRTFDRGHAESVCRDYNAHRKTNIFVMVDAPEADQDNDLVVVMSIRTAIAADFLYSWVV